MKKNIKNRYLRFLLFIHLVFICVQINAALKITDQFLSQKTDQQLEAYVKNALAKNIALQTESVEGTQKLQEIINAAQSFSLEQKKKADALLGSAQAPGYEPLSFDQEAASEETNQNKETTVNDETPSTSPAPPAPPAPPLLDGAQEKVEKEELKEIPQEKKAPKPVQPQEPDYIMPDLNDNEFSSLSQKDKEKSDQLVLSTLQEIANESFTGAQKKLTPKAYKVMPNINSAREAYDFYIKDMLMALGANQLFKNRVALRTFLGVNKESKPLADSLQKMITDDNGKSSFFKKVYDDLNDSKSTILDELVLNVQSLFFDPSMYQPALRDALEDIIINYAISQRVPVSGTAATRAISDGLVYEVFELITDAIRQEIGNVSGDDEKSKELSTDYMRVLSRAISRLRLNSQFLRFEGLQGSAARLRAISAGNPIEQLRLYPMLELLKTTDISLLDRKKMLLAANGQLVFKDESLKPIFDQTDLIDALLKDRIMRLLKGRKNIDFYEFLEDTIPGVADTKQLANILTMLQKSVGSKPAAQEIQAELKKLDTNPDVVITKFKQLVGKNDLSFEKQVRKLIETHLKEKEIAIKGIEILQAARAQYEKTKKPVDALVLDLLKKKRNEVSGKFKFDAAIKKFMALDRTPDAVARIFSYDLAIGQEVSKYAKKEDFRAWFAPYGLLLDIIKDAPETAKDVAAQGPRAQFDVLLDSIKALNAGTMQGRVYAKPLGLNRELVFAGVYKNKLNDLIKALEEYYIGKAVFDVTAIVAAAGIGIEQSDEFETQMIALRKFLVTVFFAELLSQLVSLNAGNGEEPIEGLALEGSASLRNAQLYAQLKGAFKPLVALLKPNNISRDMGALSVLGYEDFAAARDAVMTSLQEILDSSSMQGKYSKSPSIDEQKKEITAAFARYFDRLFVRIPSSPDGKVKAVESGILKYIQAGAQRVLQGKPAVAPSAPPTEPAKPRGPNVIPPPPPLPPAN